MRHRFGLIAAIFEELADGGGPFCENARDLGGVFGGVERVGIEPDRPQAFADMLVAQIFQIDAEAAAVGELAIVATLSREVGKDFNRMADVADKDEGRPDMFGGKGAGILFGLFTRVAHQDVPATMRAASSARGCCRKAGLRLLTGGQRSEEHTSELQSLMRLSY